MALLLLWLSAAALQASGALAAYIFPDIVIQAKSGGGVKAFLPASCGVEMFGFQVKTKSEESWKTGNGTRDGRFWTWEDRARQVKVGDELEYSPRVWYRGTVYSLPISKWHVSELVDNYVVPALNDKEEDCASEEVSSKEKEDVKHSKQQKEEKHQKQNSNESNSKENSEEKPSPPLTSVLGSRMGKKIAAQIQDPTAEKKEEPKGPEQVMTQRPRPLSPPPAARGKAVQDKVEAKEEVEEELPQDPRIDAGPPFSLSCNFLEPVGPDLSRDEAVERQLSILQCEMAAFLDRTTKLTAELNRELLDLKKLNYATVDRMAKLEALIKTIPRAVPFSYFSEIN